VLCDTVLGIGYAKDPVSKALPTELSDARGGSHTFQVYGDLLNNHPV